MPRGFKEGRYTRPQIEQPSDVTIRHIPLTQGQYAIVDASDYEDLSRHLWCARKHPTTGYFYAARNLPRTPGTRAQKSVMMHRQLMGDAAPAVDHVNHNTLDNRRCNLRPCTISQNGGNRRRGLNNTSGYKGVCFAKDTGKWQAMIGIHGKQVYLGQFSTPELAHGAYLRAASNAFGAFACAG